MLSVRILIIVLVWTIKFLMEGKIRIDHLLVSIKLIVYLLSYHLVSSMTKKSTQNNIRFLNITLWRNPTPLEALEMMIFFHRQTHKIKGYRNKKKKTDKENKLQKINQ